MPVRRIRAPALVALAAGAAGAIGIASVLTPEFADRTRLVEGILPPGWPEAARTLTLAFSLALLVLARGLARRKRRAWQLAVALVIGSAITHLAKGLDVEEAIGSLIVLVLLLRTRREFVAPGDPESVRPLLQVGLALAVALPFAVLPIDGTVAYSDRVDDALLILIGALAVRGFFLWLRPIAERARHVPDDFGAPRRSSSSTGTTASPTSRSGRTSRGSSRRAATRSSRTASSPAPRSSPATRSAIPPSAAS